jgi:hypothetical protein
MGLTLLLRAIQMRESRISIDLEFFHEKFIYRNVKMTAFLIYS